ncbi:MAG: 4-(cytidine 5'-diphospho)-2-C-methyl-D-erythritol kinase [Ruminococcaceae bacterium]|nr:4-(cytidine 5'-diphospho)-2-C-methyl-D-erythritol kinase [Oscillospiraceae bacterium]
MLSYSTVKEKGYAKINLHLDITGRLEGGYHAVATVMQTVTLCDEITIEDIKHSDVPSFEISCNKPDVPCDERNLAYKAALLFCEASGVNVSAKIHIEKNIPMAAGMAGGSTDGAAVLRGLNKAFGEMLSTERICEIGSRLGADVPFCVVGGTAYADGKGDVLHVLPNMPRCYILVACEGEGVSTPWAYKLLDGIYSDFNENSGYEPKDIGGLLDSLNLGDKARIAAEMYNIFEAPVLAERPVARKVKALMMEGGAVNAMMSGSGPSVFGIFMSEDEAKNAQRLLYDNGFKGYVCVPCV